MFSPFSRVMPTSFYSHGTLPFFIGHPPFSTSICSLSHPIARSLLLAPLSCVSETSVGLFCILSRTWTQTDLQSPRKGSQTWLTFWEIAFRGTSMGGAFVGVRSLLTEAGPSLENVTLHGKDSAPSWLQNTQMLNLEDQIARFAAPGKRICREKVARWREPRLLPTAVWEFWLFNKEFEHCFRVSILLKPSFNNRGIKMWQTANKNPGEHLGSVG